MSRIRRPWKIGRDSVYAADKSFFGKDSTVIEDASGMSVLVTISDVEELNGVELALELCDLVNGKADGGNDELLLRALAFLKNARITSVPGVKELVDEIERRTNT